MQYTKLNFLANLIPELKAATEREIKFRGEDNVVASTIGFLELPRRILEQHLLQYGFPELHTCILFSRPAGEVQEIHVDCSSADDLELIRCAINVPIENCDDSNMVWYGGEYKFSTSEYIGKDRIKRKYVTLNWHNTPEELDRTIINVPSLVKVCVPHNVTTTQKHRKLLTFRFKGNPSYEEIAELFRKIY
jgi:hypothetical protein